MSNLRYAKVSQKSYIYHVMLSSFAMSSLYVNVVQEIQKINEISVTLYLLYNIYFFFFTIQMIFLYPTLCFYVHSPVRWILILCRHIASGEGQPPPPFSATGIFIEFWRNLPSLFIYRACKNYRKINTINNTG